MTKFMTQTEYANHRGVSQPRVSQFIRSGKIPASAMKRISGKKLIDMEKADAALKDNLDRAYNPNPKKPGTKNPGKKAPKPQPTIPPDAPEKTAQAGTSDMTLARAQQIQAQYKAALLKLEFEEKNGKLISLEQVETDFFNIGRRFRDAVLNIPDRVSAGLASDTDQHSIAMKLTEELTQALEELSRE
jgi:hypothetical protein